MIDLLTVRISYKITQLFQLYKIMNVFINLIVGLGQLMGSGEGMSFSSVV